MRIYTSGIHYLYLLILCGATPEICTQHTEGGAHARTRAGKKILEKSGFAKPDFRGIPP